MISRIGNARRIAAALVVAMLVAGCTHETYIVDAKHPEVEYSEDGSLKWHGRFIQPEELPHLLEILNMYLLKKLHIMITSKLVILMLKYLKLIS